MKKILFLIVAVCLCSNLFAQNQDEVTKKDSTFGQMQFLYCQILGTQKLMSNKVTINIDFGQINKMLSDQRLRDEDGNVVVFNSMVDAMNWMGAKGWEFVQAYVVTVGGQNVYHWLLKKSINKLTEKEKAELLEEFRTKKDFKKDKN